MSSIMTEFFNFYTPQKLNNYIYIYYLIVFFIELYYLIVKDKKVNTNK